MEHKVNKHNIRDRFLSLFIVLGMLTGLFTGLATPKQAEAGDNLKRTIKLGGDDYIEYDPKYETITYQKVHPLAHSSVRYYTHDFVLSIDPIDSNGYDDLSDAVDIETFKVDPSSAKNVKRLRIPLRFDPENPGESLSREDAESIGKADGFYWWDDIDVRKDIVTTTYVFNADIIFDFLEYCGYAITDKVYIHHIFAMKWPGHEGDSICTLPKHEPYWQLRTEGKKLGIVDEVSWSNRSSVYTAMKSCLNIPVPIYREVPIALNYYDVDTGEIVDIEKGKRALTMVDGSDENFRRVNPYTLEDIKDVMDVPYKGKYFLVKDGKFGSREPFVMFSASASIPSGTKTTYDDHKALALEIEAQYDGSQVSVMEFILGNKYGWYRYGCTLNYAGSKSSVSFDTRRLYGRANVLSVYVPVRKGGSEIFLCFYDKDTDKGITSVAAQQLESATTGSTNTLRSFEVPESLADEYELASTGAFDVHGTDYSKVIKYSDAKNMSTKKVGAYAPLAKKYTIKEAIAENNRYCIWIPLQKKVPERKVYIGFFDADKLTQVGVPFQKTFNIPIKEGDKNVNVSISLPSGSEYAGYAIKNTGAFDIPAASISSVLSYSSAKNSTARRTGTYTGSKYTISEIPKGKDVVIWVPLSKGEGTPINVYIQYVTNTGTKLKDFKASDTATIGAEYTHSAESVITYNGETYVPANESQYGSRAPKALYSTTSNDMSSASYNGTYKNNKYDVTKSSLKYSFTPTVADTKAVKLFIPYVKKDTRKTNVRIVYINSSTGSQIGDMVESNDYRRGDTIIPSNTLPSGYVLDLSDAATYKRLAVYAAGSDGIKSNYSDAKSKIGSKLTNLDFNSASNCNCDVPTLDDEKLAVKVFVPVKPNTTADGTMLAIKYFYVDAQGKYKFLDKEVKWNTQSSNGYYDFNKDYSDISIKESIYANGKTYAPTTLLGMLYGDDGAELYGSENPMTTSASRTEEQGVFGYVYSAYMQKDSATDKQELGFTTMDKGKWHTAYILCSPQILPGKLVIHYIDADKGTEIYTETDKDYMKSDQYPQTWSGIEGELAWGYGLGAFLKETVKDSKGNSYSPVYFTDTEHVTEKECTCTTTRTFHYMFTYQYEDSYSPTGFSWTGQTSHHMFCTKCGGIVRYESSSLSNYGWSPFDGTDYEHSKIRNFNYPYSYKTRIYVGNESNLDTFDKSYSGCSDAKFNFINRPGSTTFVVKNPKNPDLGYTSSTSDSYPMRGPDGNAMVLYIPCKPVEDAGYNVTVKYITLKSNGSADKVVAEANGGKATVGSKYTYTGKTSVKKDGVTYTVLGEGEWLAYGTNNYGQAKGDTENKKGNEAEYDGGKSWTTKKKYSQEMDGTLYIPVAPAVKVTVKYVTLKSGNKIKKTIATVDGGYAEYGKKYSYTGAVSVKDGSGKEYVVVGTGEALAYGSNSYADALSDSENKKGHKSKFDEADTWTSLKKYNSYEDGTLYIPVNSGVPVTIIYFKPHSGGPNTIESSAIVKQESGVPGVPGQTYKTSIVPYVEVGEDTYQVADKSKTGITWPTSGKTEKVWDYSNDTNVRSGTKITTTIPSDADEFYILVPVRKVDSPGPDPIDPEDDKKSDVWDPTPKAVIKSDIYEVKKAIPSSEYVYSEITTDKYVLGVKLRNVTGTKSYSVTVYQTVHVMDPDDPDKEISHSDLSATGTASRNYDYWVIDDLVLYGPSEAWVRNGAVEDDFKAAFANDLPAIEKSILGSVDNHITEPTYSSSSYLSDAYITMGTVYDISSTAANSEADSIVGNIMVKNDTLKIGGKTVIDSTLSDTSASDPVMGNVPGKSAAGTVTVKVAEQQIPEARTNIKYDSKGEVTYVLKDEYPSNGHAAKLVIEIPDINPVKVHTPVLCKITLVEDNLKYVQDVNADKSKAHAVVGRSDSDGSEGYENSTSDFVLKVDVNGTHISEKGYGTRSDYDKYIVGHGTNVNGTAYPKGVMACFPFDVVADVGGDGNEANDIVLSADTWNRMYPSYYVPEWVEPGSYKVKVCVYAINAIGKEDKEQKNKNTTDTNYVAYDEAEIEISGKVYGLTLTSNTSTAPDWKDVFTSSSRIKWAYPNKYPDGTYLDAFNKANRYYYMTGIKNELGLDMKTLVTQTVKVKNKDTKVTTLETKRDRYIFPLIDGSSPVAKGTGTLKSGYTWNFQISTAGRVTANDNSTLVVVPSFYWISRDGKKREKVDVWYSGKIDGKTYNLIKVGSELDKKNVFTDYALSETMGIPKSELSMVETLRGNKDVLSANTPIYTYGMISLGRNTKTFPNEAYASLFKSKTSQFTEKQLMQFKQNWYFKYSMPDVYHVCPAGTDVEAYAKKNGGVTYKESFWHTRGFLVIHFDIGVYDKTGKLVLTYTNSAQNVKDGMCDMWNMEGYVTDRTDFNGTKFTFVDGDVILLRLPGSTTPGTPDDPEDPDNPPGKPGDPGDPTPPTNSSEDKQVNRTN